MFRVVVIELAQPIASEALGRKPLVDRGMTDQGGEGRESPPVKVIGDGREQAARAGSGEGRSRGIPRWNTDLAKMLVHRRARRQGLGAALMRAAEATARGCGKTLLVLDAVTGGDAARLYERLGWERVGDIPGYALLPRGGLCSTTVYYRKLVG